MMTLQSSFVGYSALCILTSKIQQKKLKVTLCILNSKTFDILNKIKRIYKKLVFYILSF